MEVVQADGGGHAAALRGLCDFLHHHVHLPPGLPPLNTPILRSEGWKKLLNFSGNIFFQSYFPEIVPRYFFTKVETYRETFKDHF